MSGSSNAPRYQELHCHSAYSFGDGASSPEELARRAAELGYEALALTDHDGLWGSMEHAQACRAAGVRPITGAELTVSDGGEPFHLTLLVESAAGYRNLCRLVTEAHAETRPHPDRDPLPPLLTLDSLEERSAGLVCLSGCARDGALAGRWERGEPERAARLGRRLAGAFGRERFRVELQRPLWRNDRARNRWLEGLAARLGVPCVATGNVHMHDRGRAPLQDALVAVSLHGSLESTEPGRRGNRSSAMASPVTMAARFREHPAAVARSAQLAERLHFDLTSDLGYAYPGSEDSEADPALAAICRARLEHRYAGMPERAAAERRLEEELRDDRQAAALGVLPPPLRPARAGSRGRRRGARPRLGADAAAAGPRPRLQRQLGRLLSDRPLPHRPGERGLFLGRFLNDEIAEAPDIDLDFPRDIRERLIPRIHERYGPERSALVSAFACYRSRSAVRDLGKVLGLPAGEIERAAGIVDVYDRPESVERDIAEAMGEARARSRRWRALAALARESWGLPRHASQHPGGMVLSTQPLIDLCPVQPAAMEGRQIAQWDKDSCADAGFLKIDLLGLGMLSAVERAVERSPGCAASSVDLSRIPLDDPEVFGAIQRAETTGVFQIESRAQMQMLPRSLPRDPRGPRRCRWRSCAPGPIQGGAVHPYLERKKRLREDPDFQVPYEHPSLEPILADTLGAIVFQDQVIQVAMALAGFSPGEAEGLRRAMSRKRSEEAHPRLSRALRRGRGRARSRPRGRRARLRAGPGVLRLRLSQVACRGVRPARLPVDVAAGPLPARAPLLAPERAADGLLPVGLAGPRGAASGIEVLGRGRQRAATSTAPSSPAAWRCASASAT